MQDQISREEFEALKGQVKSNRLMATIALMGVGFCIGYLIGTFVA